LVADPAIEARQEGRRVVISAMRGRTVLRFTHP
jgi:hypothetical protein